MIGAARVEKLGGSFEVYRVEVLGRWWTLTERGARRLVWGTFGWTHLVDDIDATYSKARIGYRVRLDQRWPRKTTV